MYEKMQITNQSEKSCCQESVNKFQSRCHRNLLNQRTVKSNVKISIVRWLSNISILSNLSQVGQCGKAFYFLNKSILLIGHNDPVAALRAVNIPQIFLMLLCPFKFTINIYYEHFTRHESRHKLYTDALFSKQ